MRSVVGRLMRPKLTACVLKWRRDWEVSVARQELLEREGLLRGMHMTLEEENAVLHARLAEAVAAQADEHERMQELALAQQQDERIRELEARLQNEHAARLRAQEQERQYRAQLKQYEAELRDFETELVMVGHEADLGISIARAASPVHRNP
mmetsp:Transcript_28305/g.82778  ORF Transcript_28305/g.82778 Transcript_28305/m.82778 type:complete len:152 (+) Transcript_28305:2-457(+)